MRPLHRLAGPALVALVAMACLSPRLARSGLTASPHAAELRGAQVFDAHGIPVLERTIDGWVLSGTFFVNEVWGGGAVAERVSCGGPEFDDTFHDIREIRLSVTLRVRALAGMDGPRTSVSIGSRGRTVPHSEDGERMRCRLRAAFVEQMLDAVAGYDLPSGPFPVAAPTAP